MNKAGETVSAVCLVVVAGPLRALIELAAALLALQTRYYNHLDPESSS